MLQGHRISELNDGTLKLHFEAWDETEIKIRVSPPHADELIGLLKENGAKASLGVEFSAGQTLEIVAATVGSEAFWTALGATVATFLTRRRGRKIHVKVGDMEIDVEGHSPREAEKIIETISKQHAEVVERELKRQKPKPPAIENEAEDKPPA
jgi:hypothetical protein